MSDQLSSDLASLKIDRSAPRPKGKSPLGTIVVVVRAAGRRRRRLPVWACPYSRSAVFKTEVDTTEVITVSPAQASVELTSTGYVVAQSVSAVASKVAGKVKAQHVRQGAKVKAGDVLLEIDPSDQNASIATAMSQAAAARARIMMARADVSEIEQQAKRALLARARRHRPEGHRRRPEGARRLAQRAGQGLRGRGQSGRGAGRGAARQPGQLHGQWRPSRAPSSTSRQRWASSSVRSRPASPSTWAACRSPTSPR